MRTNKDFQRIITKHLTYDEKIAVGKKNLKAEYGEFVDAETVPQKVKEACDRYIVAEAMELFTGDIEYIFERWTAKQYIESVGIDFDAALQKVVDSNFSKFILESELDEAKAHFDNLGISVRFDHLEGSLFGAYSTKDQKVNGKLYERDKLLKGPKYAAVDESINWWE